MKTLTDDYFLENEFPGAKSDVVLSLLTLCSKCALISSRHV